MVNSSSPPPAVAAASTGAQRRQAPPAPSASALPTLVPPGLLPTRAQGQSGRLLAAYDEVVRSTCQFSKDVGDVVRGDPVNLAGILSALSQAASHVFRKWNVEVLYLLSVENELRFSEVRSFVPGISSRSLSLKLDEMEQLGLVRRRVSDDKPPHVLYSLTEGGRTMTRLSLPMALSLLMDHGLRDQLSGKTPTHRTGST